MAKLSIEYGKTKKDGSRSVMIRIVSGKTQKHIPTHVNLEKNEYKEYSDGRIKVTNNSKYFDIEDFLSDLQTKVNALLRNNYGVTLTAEQIASYALRPSKNDVRSMNFFDFAEKYIDSADMKAKHNYRSSLNSLRKFYGSSYLPFGEMTVELLTRYCKSLSGKKRAQSLYLSSIRHIYNQAALRYNDDYEISLSPYLFVKFKVPRQNPARQRALSVEELKEFFRFKADTKNSRIAKDCALLSICLCGTNLVDLYNATSYDGHVLSYDREKTKDRRNDNAHIEIDVDDRIKFLFDRYKCMDGKKVFFFGEHSGYSGFCDSIIKGLAHIRRRMNWDVLQFYQFRHSMATIARNELGIDKATVDEMLNHVGSNRIADIYIKKDFRQINIANKKVVDYLFENIIQK